MNEELKQRALDWINGKSVDCVALLIPSLIEEIDRLNEACAVEVVKTLAANKVIAELEQRAEQPKPSLASPIMEHADAMSPAMAEQPKFNQCAEVCERAKLCAICAGPVSEQPKPERVAVGYDESADGIAVTVRQGDTVIWYRHFAPLAIPEPKPEPVAWMSSHDRTDLYFTKPKQVDVVPLYTAPPAPSIPESKPEAAEPDLTALYDLFGIGSGARNVPTLLINVVNTLRRSRCLDAIEHEFFTVEYLDTDPDSGNLYTECLMSWGAEPAEYVEQYRAALAAKFPAPPAIPEGYALVPENATPYQVEAMTVMAETMLSAVGKLDVALIYGTGIEAAKVQQP